MNGLPKPFFFIYTPRVIIKVVNFMDMDYFFYSKDEKRRRELEDIKEDFIKRGYDFFLTFDLRKISYFKKETRRIIKENNNFKFSNVKLNSLYERLREIPENKVFFIYQDTKGRQNELIKGALDEDMEIEELLSIDPSEEGPNILVILDEKRKDKIKLLHNLIYDSYVNWGTFGGYKINGLGFNSYLKFLKVDGFRLLSPMEDLSFNFLGEYSILRSTPDEVYTTRVSVESLIEKAFIGGELELYLYILKKLAPIIQKSYVKSKRISMSSYIDSRIERNKILSSLVSRGKIVSRWTKESNLFILIKEIYKDALYQYSPNWLSPQSLDIYIPSLDLAIEYQGEQHYLAFEHLDGQNGLSMRKENDKIKRGRCRSHGVRLLEWHYKEEITKENLQKKLREFL